MTAAAETSLPTNWHTILAGVFRAFDILLVLLSAFVAFWIRHESLDIPAYYQWAMVLGAVLAPYGFQVVGLYRADVIASNTAQAVRFTVAWVAVMATLLALAYFTQISDWFSRGWVGWWFGLVFGGAAVSRLGLALWRGHLRRQGELRLRVAIVGARDLGRSVLRQIRETHRDDVEIIGVYDDPSPDITEMEGVPVRGSVDDLVILARRERIDEILVAMVDRSEEEIQGVLSKLRLLPVNTRLCAHSLRFNVPVRGYSTLAGLPLLHVFDRPLGGWGGILKALEDRVLGALITLMVLPIMAIIAIAIKLDSPGPVLFRQKRYGFNNNEIVVFKFRSMRTDQAPDPKVTQAKKGDPRITRVGGFLRKSSLDELPQLFNVLLGEMSLVGPRPHAVAHNEHYAGIIDGYLGRHRVKPGITGWAQVNGYRGETDTPEKMLLRVQYDLYYIDNWSLLFDLKILLMTGLVGFVHKNAY